MEIPLEERQEIISDEMLAPYAYYLRKYTDKDYRVLSEEALTAETLMEGALNSENTRKIFDNVELILRSYSFRE